MYITKQGVIPPEQKYEVTCGNCKTEFEFIESEGSWVCGSGEESTLLVKCPLCGKFLGLTVNHSETTHEQTQKSNEKAFKEMSERIKLKRELNGRATKHEIDL